MHSNFALGWRQVAICFVVMGAVAVLASSYSVVAVHFEAEFKPSRSRLLFAMTVLSTVAAILATPLGALMDKVSMRLMMMLGACFLGAGYLALSQAQSFNQVLVIYGLLFAPANMLLGPLAATVLISRWFHKQRGRALGIAIAGIAAGSVIYPQVLQALFNAFAWRTALLYMGLILFCLTMMAALLVINRPSDRGLFADGANREPEVVARADSSTALSAWAILAEPSFWLVALLLAIVASGMKGMVTNLTLLAVGVGIPASAGATLISTYAACGFFAKLGFAAVADWLNPKVLILMSLLGFAGGMALMLLAASGGYWAVFTSVAVIGLFGGLMVPLESLLLARIFGVEFVGKAMGLCSTVSMLALLTTPTLFGWIFDIYGSYNGIFLFFAVIAVMTACTVPFMSLRAKALPTVPVT